MLGRPSEVDKYLKDDKKIVRNKKNNKFPVGVPLKMAIFTNSRFETIKRATSPENLSVKDLKNFRKNGFYDFQVSYFIAPLL